MPQTDAVRARQVLERLRGLVHAIPWPRRTITLSFGTAVYQPQTEDSTDLEPIANLLITRANQALYQAKGGEKDCVVLWSEENAHDARP